MASTSQRVLCWHVSSSLNRDSIAAHGLDWRRIGATGGIATGTGLGGPYQPELEAVFLCDSLDAVEFFVGFDSHPLVDVWQVDASGLAIEPGPEGWLICRTPIPPSKIRLLHQDRPPEPRPLCSVALSFASDRLSIEEMTRLAGTAPDRSGIHDGYDLGLTQGRRYSYWVLEGSDRYAPLDHQVDEFVARIIAAERGLTQLAAAAVATTFWVYAESTPWILTPEIASLLDRIGATPRIPAA